MTAQQWPPWELPEPYTASTLTVEPVTPASLIASITARLRRASDPSTTGGACSRMTRAKSSI